jgi:hypothetical protein
MLPVQRADLFRHHPLTSPTAAPAQSHSSARPMALLPGSDRNCVPMHTLRCDSCHAPLTQGRGGGVCALAGYS